MSELIKNTELLMRLSDDSLEGNFRKVILIERKVLYLVLEHIKEIDRRRLYLVRGYDSSVSYLVKSFGYSRTAAEHRLYAARLIQEVPSISDKLKAGTVNLSQLCQISSAVKQKERLEKVVIGSDVKASLVRLVEGKTGWDSQGELCRALNIPLKEPERQSLQKDESVHLEITFSKRQYDIFIKCREAGFHLLQKNSDHSIAGLIEILCLQFLKSKKIEIALKEDPKSTSRNDGPDRNDSLVSSEYMAADSDPDSVSKVHHERQKNISAKIRQLILKRDKCCQFIDKKTGVICESRIGLQVDHVVPVWAGGINAPENLQALCGAHNRMKYREQAGIRLYRPNGKW